MDSFITMMAEMPFWYWWVLGTVLLIGEIVTGTTYILWPAVAAFITGFFDLGPFDGNWQLQLFLFAGITILLTIFATPYAKAWVNNEKTDKVNLNERGAQKVGKRVVADEDFSGGTGRVRLGDTVWSAEADPALSVLKGAALEIREVKGTVLVVAPVS